MAKVVLPSVLFLALFADPAGGLLMTQHTIERSEGKANTWVNASAGTAGDPTAGGHMGDFAQSQLWVQSLLANRAAGQSQLALAAPVLLQRLKAALQEPTNLTAQVAACAMVGSACSQSHEAKPYVASAGGLDVGIAALRAFPLNRAVQLSCAHAVGMMSMYQKDVMEAAGRAGAVELVLDMQRRWKMDPHVQIGGLSGCFHDFSYDNRLRWQKAGGVEYNMETIRNHYNNSKVVLECWYAFSSGTQSPNERAFVDAGGIELAIRSMNDHKNYSRVREEAMQALRAVGRCPSCGEFQERMVAAGLLQSLASAMREVPLDIHTQSPACANVAILTRSSAKHRRKAVEAGLTELAMQAVKSFPQMVSSVDWAFNDQYTVYEDCLEALAHLVQDAEGKAILRSFGGSRTEVLKAMALKPNVRVTLQGQQVLAGLL